MSTEQRRRGEKLQEPRMFWPLRSVYWALWTSGPAHPWDAALLSHECWMCLESNVSFTKIHFHHYLLIASCETVTSHRGGCRSVRCFRMKQKRCPSHSTVPYLKRHQSTALRSERDPLAPSSGTLSVMPGVGSAGSTTKQFAFEICLSRQCDLGQIAQVSDH